MYTGYKLDNVQRAKLLLQYIPKYKRVIAEHVTLCLGKHIPYEIKSVRAYGFVESEGMQYFLCEVNGNKINEYNQKPFHVTWSIDPNKHKPVATGEHAKNNWEHLQYHECNILLEGALHFY